MISGGLGWCWGGWGVKTENCGHFSWILLSINSKPGTRIRCIDRQAVEIGLGNRSVWGGRGHIYISSLLLCAQLYQEKYAKIPERFYTQGNNYNTLTVISRFTVPLTHPLVFCTCVPFLIFYGFFFNPSTLIWMSWKQG